MRLRENKEAIEKTSEKEASEKEAIEKAAWGGFLGGIKHQFYRAQVVVLYKTAACHGSFCLQNQFFLFGIGILLFLLLIAH